MKSKSFRWMNIPAAFVLAGAGAYAQSNLFFYNHDSGLGWVTTADRGQAPQALFTLGFSPGWTAIATGRSSTVLFYNQDSGAAVMSRVSPTGAISDQSNAMLGPGWSHMVDVQGIVLLYNTGSGLAMTGTFDDAGTFHQFPTTTMLSPGWTHIVVTDSQSLLFYNATNGAGAVGYLRQTVAPGCSGTTCQPVDAEVITQRSYSDFTVGWTNIVETHDGILFYRAADGLMAVADMNAATGDVGTRPNSAGHLKQGFTSVASGQHSLVFYNSSNGDVALGHIQMYSSHWPPRSYTTVAIDSSLPSFFPIGWTIATPVYLPSAQ